MPFDCSNAPDTFQGFVTNVFCDLLDNYDILVRMWEEHVHIQEDLSQLWLHCLYAKLKYAFLQQHTDFLGQSIAPKGMSMVMKKTDILLFWQSPLVVCGMHCF